MRPKAADHLSIRVEAAAGLRPNKKETAVRIRQRASTETKRAAANTQTSSPDTITVVSRDHSGQADPLVARLRDELEAAVQIEELVRPGFCAGLFSWFLL